MLGQLEPNLKGRMNAITLRSRELLEGPKAFERDKNSTVEREASENEEFQTEILGKKSKVEKS